MHMVDCKGVAAWVFGGVLHYLLREPSLGNNKQERLDAVNQGRLVWYGQHRKIIKLPRILMASCQGSDGWADLSGPAFKAANTRAAARCFNHTSARHMQSCTVANRHARLARPSLVGFLDCLYFLDCCGCSWV